MPDPDIRIQITDPKQEAELERTTHYAQHNVVPAREGRKCVDGRYLPNQARGMIARPGGDCGYVMALMAVSKKKQLGFTPEQCFNEVFKVVARKLQGEFCMHTDHHVDPVGEKPKHPIHGPMIGCGHLVKASTDKLADAYDVDSQDVRRIVEYSRNLAEISRSMQMVNLDGEHQESGVLVINSDKYTINADDPLLKRMYFIYDKKRDEEFMKKLVEKMDLPGVTFEDMREESDIQLNATLRNLAKDLPIYSVEFKGDEPKVTFAGVVASDIKRRRMPIPLPKFALTFLPKFHVFAPRN